jgi:zinc D-Ala-D-Ala carboxypeptidase
MSQTARARTATHGATAVGVIVVAAAIASSLLYRSAAPPASSSFGAAPAGARRAVPESASSSPSSHNEVPRGDRGRRATEDDGALPDGVTVFDDTYPGVANLDPDLLRALREAAKDAAADGIELHVNSGWRSREYQDQLLRDAISEYGSEAEAARWVASADRSAHVSGDAVDIGPVKATAWLSEHGARFGLCRIYRNESWHYELRLQAIDSGCPRMYADPPHDPRMQH